MVGWHHWPNRHESEQILRDSERQRNLACCSQWDRKESDMTYRLNKSNKVITISTSKEFRPFGIIFNDCQDPASTSLFTIIAGTLHSHHLRCSPISQTHNLHAFPYFFLFVSAGNIVFVSSGHGEILLVLQKPIPWRFSSPFLYQLSVAE